MKGRRGANSGDEGDQSPVDVAPAASDPADDMAALRAVYQNAAKMHDVISRNVVVAFCC